MTEAAREPRPDEIRPLQGYSLPRSPEGKASLVPLPPWHYVGDFLVLEYWADPEAVAAVLPQGLEPFSEDQGRAAALLVDWQSCTDSREELLDPARSQYKEFFVVVNALLDGEPVTTCPYIWVDRDFSLVRGWIQGFPKKLGSIWLTRTFGLDCAADPGVKPGAVFGGTVAANDRRIAQGSVTLEMPAVHELVRARSRERSISEIWEGEAALELYPAPNEEHTALAPVRMGRGFRFTFAYTVDDLATVKEL